MMDYRTLLIKYIAHVGEIEGIDFLSDYYRTGQFSDDEWAALKKLEQESING